MTTTYYRIRMYVGPVHVAHFAANARRAGMTDIIEGTEHIYATVGAETCRDETDRLLLRHRVSEMIYGEPGMVTGWRDVGIL